MGLLPIDAAVVSAHGAFRVMSAKKEETRLKRLRQLIEDSAEKRSIKELRRG